MNTPSPPLSILVDGYNLMLGSVVGPDPCAGRNLHDARRYFLNWLERTLEPSERASVCVVFDTSRQAQRDQHSQYHGIRIVYSASHSSADECIQQLIKDHTSPQKLTVVSSDHQIQRAAKARGAHAIDSEIWIESLSTPKSRTARQVESDSSDNEKPDGDIDARKWLDEFGF